MHDLRDYFAAMDEIKNGALEEVESLYERLPKMAFEVTELVESALSGTLGDMLKRREKASSSNSHFEEVSWKEIRKGKPSLYIVFSAHKDCTNWTIKNDWFKMNGTKPSKLVEYVESFLASGLIDISKDGS